MVNQGRLKIGSSFLKIGSNYLRIGPATGVISVLVIDQSGTVHHYDGSTWTTRASSGEAIGDWSMVEVGVVTAFGKPVSDGSGDDAAVNVASFSAGVRPLRAMEKRSWL